VGPLVAGRRCRRGGDGGDFCWCRASRAALATDTRGPSAPSPACNPAVVGLLAGDQGAAKGMAGQRQREGGGWTVAASPNPKP